MDKNDASPAPTALPNQAINYPAQWIQALEFTKKVHEELRLKNVDDGTFSVNIFIELVKSRP